MEELTFKCEGCKKVCDVSDFGGTCPYCDADLCINCIDDGHQTPCCGTNWLE